MATNRTASPSVDTVSTSVSPRQRGDIDTLSAFQGVISNEDAERQTERLIRLYREKSQGGIPDQNSYKICLLHDDRKWHHAAHDVNQWYTSKNLPCHIRSYCDDGWFDEVQRLKASHYLFFGLPPFEKGKKGFLKRTPRSPVESQQEIDFFTLGGGGPTNLKLNNVVVVLPEKISTKKEYRQKISGHYLEHYVKLDGQKTPSVLAASALGIFIAPQPKPMESDKAYWSANPKLVEDFRVSSEVPLGLTIMTREMAEGAPFERIVLINSISSNYRYEFYARVGRYTHIQSINGILLDGLSVEKVTDVFKKLPDHHVQMLIRYIHMGERDGRKNSGASNEVGHPSGTSPLRELPNRQSVASSDIPPSTIPSSRNETQLKPSTPAEKSLILPLPLFILGDNYSLCKQLYTALKAEPPPPYSELASRGSTTPTDNGGADFSSGVRGGGGRVGNGGSHLPPKRSTSMPQGSNSSSYNRLEHRGSQGSGITNDESADVLTPLIQRPITLNMESDNRHVRRRTSSFRGISSSDKFIQRCEMPMNKFEKLPSLQDNPETDMTINSPLSPGNTPKPVSTEMLPQHQFILHLPLPELDRFMSHLYFKASGIYLVVIGLEDLIANPVCQYENLFYWINLIHTYVSPDAKRMFVVGLYKRSMIEQKHVIESLKVLNRVLANYRQMVKIPLEEQGYVYLFDLENQEAECQYLCSCILNCTRLFAKSSYYFTREFHDHVFSPFREFQKIASDIGLNHDRALLESKYVMGQRFCMLFDQQQHPIHLPMGYYETLANYSTACISRHCDGCLLIPSVIPELLNLCARLSEYDTQIFDDPDLRGLPLFSIHMLRHGFKILYPNNSKDFEMVIWWMEHLSIIYSVGKKRVQGDERFFVPFLLHYHLSDRPMYEWDEEKVEGMFVDAITLYAQFSSNVPMTIHLFHKILAYILQSVLKIGAQADCFINPDSPEVVLPLHDDNSNDDLGPVLVRFLAVQNIIEFKSNVSNRMRFLHVVENKLSKAFLGSKYYNKTIDVNRVVSFRVPADSFTRETTHPHVWDLAELESSMDDKEEHLVATSHLTEPGNRKKTPALRRWADQDPEMKELPIELAHEISQRLSLSEQWVTFVVKLHLMQNDEILLRKQKPYGDPGAEALQKWKDSSKTLVDLSECLRILHLDNIADKVDTFIGGDDVADPSPYPSKIREKKLPTELFMELSTALNFNEKWALLGSYLNLLKTSEIEALKLKAQVDKGGHVLSLWTDSHLTYQDLINGLQNQKVGLNVYVPKIEAIIKSHNAQL